MLDYKDIINKNIKDKYEEEKTNVVSSIWEEDPVDFRTFVESPDYANHIHLSKAQYYEIERFAGTDPKKMFELGRPNIEVVGECGKGCLDKNTRIKDVITGERHTIQQWSKLNKGINLYTLDETTNKVVIVESNPPFKKGKDTVYAIIIDNLYFSSTPILKVTEEHKFFTSDRKWKKLKDLKVGDSLIRLVPSENNFLDAAKILEIKKIGTRDYYDLEVPVYHNYFLNGFLNHNSGKGTMFTAFETYCFYIHLCMKSPHQYYKIAEADPISAITVATSLEQSNRIFARFINRLKNNRWFASKYLIRSDKRVYSEPTKYGGHAEDEIFVTTHTKLMEEEIQIGVKTVKMPKNLEAMAVSCRTTGYEDLTMFFGLFDEASGFRTKEGFFNADEIYNTLRMTTRNLPAYIIMTSWPRLDERNDFTHIMCDNFLEKEKESRAKGERPTKFAFRYATWEMLPELYPDLVEIEIDSRTKAKAKVPRKLLDEFDPDAPEAFALAKRKYMCMAGGLVEHGYEDDPDKIESCVKNYMPNIMSEDDYHAVQDVLYVRQRITRLNLRKTTTYFIGFDQGKERAETVLWIAHIEKPPEFNKQAMVVVDGSIVWPTKRLKRRLSIDLNDVKNVLKHICEAVPVGMIRGDHWNSAILEMKLKELGVKVVLKTCGRDEYNTVRDMFHKQRILLPQGEPTQQFLQQWRSLVSSESSTTKKPLVLSGLQDSVDAFVEMMSAIKEALEHPDDLPVGIIQSSDKNLLINKMTGKPYQNIPEEQKTTADEGGILLGPGGFKIPTDKRGGFGSGRGW